MDKQITVREATNRGNNMLMAGYMAITASAIIERLIGESDLVDRSSWGALCQAYFRWTWGALLVRLPLIAGHVGTWLMSWAGCR